ncbi:MAG: hypothetical protein C0596_18645 [Marinilabiliales bacterium]|nr:MAG: hypothetical protein C0596_18645 [Marinilabiliales bacterium]
MKKVFILLLLAITGISKVSIADNDTTKISAKPLFLIYSNFHQGLTENAHESNFDVKRAYLGYDFNLNNGLNGFVKIDIGSPDDNSQYSLIRRNAYLRNVGVGYTKGNFKIKFGIIDNQQHKTQEKYWGKRYLFKSFIDEYDLLPSTDLGVNFQYKINDKIRIEAGMMNGEYLSYDTGLSKYMYNIGLDYSPVKKVKIKFHSSFTQKTNNLITSGVFLGLNPFPSLKIGGEYNTQVELKSDDEYLTYGYNAFAIYNFTDKLNIFARYDVLNSNIPVGYSAPFNLTDNGSAIIGGIEYIFNSNFRMSLNYQDWYPMAANMQNTAYLFLNVQFGIYESYKII